MRKTTPDACRTQQNRPGQWWRSRLLALAALGARVAARPVDPLARRQDTTTPTATTNASSSVTSQDSATTDTSATDTVTSPTPTAASTSLTSTSSDFTSTTPTSTTSISSQTQSSSATTTGATITSASITSLSSMTSPVETTETRTSTVPASTSTVATTSSSNGITTTRFSSSTTPTITSAPTTARSSSTSTPPVITSTFVSSVSTSDPVVSTSSSSSTTSTSDSSTSSDVTSTTTLSTSDTTASATTSTDTATTTSETRTSTSNSTTTSDTTTSTSDSTTSTSATTTSTPDTTTNTTLPTTTSTSDTTTTTSETTTPTSETSTVTTSPSTSDSGIPTTTTSTSISDTKSPTSTSTSQTVTSTSSTATSTSESATPTSSGTSTSPSSSTGSLTESQSSSSLTSTRPQPTTSSTSDTTTTSESSKEFTSLSETTLSSTTSSAASSIHVGNPADPSTTRTITGFHTSTIFQTVTTVRTGDSSTWVETTVVQTATLVPNGPSAPNSASFAHNPGAIAGTTVGILLLLVAIAVWAVFARRRAKTRRMEQNALAFGPKDDVFRPPLDESEEDLSGRPALMSERMRGGRRSTITASGLVAVTPASTSGYDSLARAAPQGMEDDGLMSEEEADEYSADLNHPDIASSTGHYVTAPTTPMPLLGTVQDPMDGTAVAGVAAAGATVLGATSRRRSGPPSPIIPRSRPSSNIEPGMWYTGKINDALIDAPASPGFSSGDGHDSNGGMASSSQGHPQTHSSGHEPMSGLNTRTSSDLQHGVWRPVGYGSSGSSTGHEFGKLQPAPRRPLATRADQSGSGSGSSSDPRRSFSPSREYGQGSGSSVGHGIAAVARAGESGSSTGHGMASAVPILVRGSREITRTPSPKLGSRSGSSHGHGTSSHGHGGPSSSQGHEASSSGHGHQRRSGQPSRVSFVEKDHPPTAFRSRSTASPTALRSTPSSPITPMRDEPLSRTGSTRSTKSYIKKSLRGRFSRRKSDAAKLTVDTDDQVASSSRGPSSPRSRAPVPTFFQSPQAAAHEQLMSQNIHISPPNSPILASSGAASSPLPPGAGYALPRPGSLGQFPNWQPTIASLAHEDAHNHEDETAWAWPGLSPGVTLPPLPSPGAESVNTPEGLLDPALASRFSRVQSANHSTAAISLGDHEDYTRPIGALSQQRMNSSTTVQTRSSQRTFDTDTGSHYSTHTVQDEHV